MLNKDQFSNSEKPIFGRLRKLPRLFILTVALPTLIAAIYFGFIASDIYVSESRYIVRTQGKQAPTGLASLIAGSDFGGLSGSSMSAVSEYALSRDAMGALNEKGRLAEIYSRPHIDIFDRFNGFGVSGSKEDLHAYFTKHVVLSSDNQSSIATLVVQAYTAEDAKWINERLLQLGEGLVNRLNQRSRADLVRSAQKEVEEAKSASRSAAIALAKYRNEQSVIDPEKQAEVSLQMVSKLQDEIIATRTQLAQLKAFTPQNPQVAVLASRVASLEVAVRDEMLKLTGGRGSLAGKSAEYTRLALEAEYAEKVLAGAMLSLQNATNDARRQQAYVERIVQPNLPDEAVQPRRLRGVFSVFVLGFVAWGVLVMLGSATREHNQ